MQKLSELLKIFSSRKSVKEDSPTAKRAQSSAGAAPVSRAQSNVARGDKDKDPDKLNSSNAKPSDRQAAIYNGVYGNWNDMLPKPAQSSQEKPQAKEVDPVTLTYKDDKRLNRPPSGNFWK